MIQNGQDTKTRSGKFAGMTDKELKEANQRHREGAGLDTEITPDLEQLRREQQRERKQERYGSMGWLERVVDQTKQWFTGGPESQYRSLVRDAENLYSQLERKNDSIDSLLSDKEQQLSSLDGRLEDTKMYAETSLEQYNRSTHRKEVLEEELEELKQTGQYSPELREKREQTRISRKEQRELYRETSKAMQALKKFKTHRKKVETQYESLSETASVYREQQDALGIQLQEWRLQQELQFPEDGRSVRKLYEDIGILSQRVERFVDEELPSYKAPDIDRTYGVKFDLDEDEDPVLVQWSKTPSP